MTGAGSLRRIADLHRLLILVIGGAGSGCSALSPSEPVVYSLVSIGGDPLPASIHSFVDSEGALRSIDAVRGVMTLYENGEFEREDEARRTLDGIVVEEGMRGGISGSYKRTKGTLVVRFRAAAGYDETLTYDMLEDGRLLRGVEWPERVYVWERLGTPQ